MRLKSFLAPVLVLVLVFSLSFLDLILYNSFLILFVSIVLTFTLLASYLLFNYIQKIVLFTSFLILLYSFYCFTIAPYSKELEENAFFTLGALMFLSIVILFAGFQSDQIKMNFSGFDKFLIVTVFITLFVSNTIVNPEELTEPQGMLKMVTLGGSLIIFGNYFSCCLYENKNILKIFLKIIVFVGLFSGIFGIMTIVNPGLIANNQYPGLATSFYKHPNATSSIYNFSIPVTIWFLVYKSKELVFLEKLIYSAGLIISLVALAFTFGRFGIAMVFLSSLILIYKYSKKLFFTIIIIALISFSFIIANFFSTKGSMTIIGRIGLLETAFEMLKDTVHLLFGYGGITTKLVFENIKFSLSVGDPNNNPHNIILYSIILYGVIFSAALFLLFFKYYLKAFYTFIRSKPSDLFILSLAVCSGLFFKNMGEDLLFFQEFFMWYLFLIFFGFLVIEINSTDTTVTKK